MATLKDVARETGLTVSTVSRVLNNRGYISKETRQKVYDAMKKLNYQPNEMARALSKKTSNTIGVILPHIDHPYFARLLNSLESAAHQNDYKLLLFNSRECDEMEDEYVEICKSARVAGIILCSGTVGISRFQGLGVPLVTVECFLRAGTAAVECDNRQGGRLAAEHLHEKGCRNVLYLGGSNLNSTPADNRETGFSVSCSELGLNCISLPEKWQKERTDKWNCRWIMGEILEEYPQIDGIFACSDEIAAQVIQACRARDIRIPEQIKVIGFDDSRIAELTSPSLTTIRQPVAEMAKHAVELIIRDNHQELVPRRTVLPVSLVEREST